MENLSAVMKTELKAIYLHYANLEKAQKDLGKLDSWDLVSNPSLRFQINPKFTQASSAFI